MKFRSFAFHSLISCNWVTLTWIHPPPTILMLTVVHTLIIPLGKLAKKSMSVLLNFMVGLLGRMPPLTFFPWGVAGSFDVDLCSWLVSEATSPFSRAFGAMAAIVSTSSSSLSGSSGRSGALGAYMVRIIASQHVDICKLQLQQYRAFI